MTLAAMFFYLFAAITVAAGFMVIAARNPVHAVLFLILAFFNAAGLFILLGAEFLAMILVVVYVGAVAVLFLFVVMMLDVDFAELRAGFMKNAPLGALVGIILLVELVLVVGVRFVNPKALAAPTPTPRCRRCSAPPTPTRSRRSLPQPTSPLPASTTRPRWRRIRSCAASRSRRPWARCPIPPRPHAATARPGATARCLRWASTAMRSAPSSWGARSG